MTTSKHVFIAHNEKYYYNAELSSKIIGLNSAKEREHFEKALEKDEAGYKVWV